jgi:hypothetical protein
MRWRWPCQSSPDADPDDPEGDEIRDPNTRKLIFDDLKDAPERQLADMNDLDAKAATLFGAASVVMGLASFGNLGVGLMGPHAVAVEALLIAAGFAYLVGAVAALLHLSPVTQRRSVFAATLQTDFREKGEDELQEWLIPHVRHAWVHNEAVTKCKARTLEWIVGALGFEVLLVVTALVVSRS